MDNVLDVFKEYIQTETLSTIVGKIENADIDKVIEMDEIKVNLTLKR